LLNAFVESDLVGEDGVIQQWHEGTTKRDSKYNPFFGMYKVNEGQRVWRLCERSSNNE